MKDEICAECKYYRNEKDGMGKCTVKGYAVFATSSCRYYKANDVASTSSSTYSDLEERVSDLETKVKLLMKAI